MWIVSLCNACAGKRSRRTMRSTCSLWGERGLTIGAGSCTVHSSAQTLTSRRLALARRHTNPTWSPCMCRIINPLQPQHKRSRLFSPCPLTLTPASLRCVSPPRLPALPGGLCYFGAEFPCAQVCPDEVCHSLSILVVLYSSSVIHDRALLVLLQSYKKRLFSKLGMKDCPCYARSAPQ